MQETKETQVRFLGQEDPLEEGSATLSTILAWRIPRTEEPGGLQCIGSQRVGHDWATDLNWLTNGIPWGSVVKNPPANAEDMGLSLSCEDTLEKKTATHSSILGWEISWTEESGRL